MNDFLGKIQKKISKIRGFKRTQNNNKKNAIQINNEGYTGPRVSATSYNVGESVTNESISQSLLQELRSETDVGKQIEIISNRDPDVSMAVWSFQRLAFQGFNIEITDLNGKRLKEVEQQFENECKSWNKLSSDGLDGIVDTLHKEGLLYNIMMVEVVASQDSKSNNTFEGIYIIDPRDIEWTLEERDGIETWIPYQNQNGDRIDLTTGNVFWTVVNQDMETPIGPYLLEPAVSAVDYKLQTMSDSSAVLRHNGYPCNVWTIDKERVVNSLPPADRNNPKKVYDAISKALTDTSSTASSREPTQDIITTDDIAVKGSPTAGSSIDVRAWTEQVDIQIMNGVKSLGILLNRSQGTTETWGSVQMKVIINMVLSFQRKSKRIVEQIGALWLQLNGIQGYFKMEHKPIDYQNENQKWEAQNKKLDYYTKAHDYRYVTADEATRETIGNENAVTDIFENGTIIGIANSGKEVYKPTENNDMENNDSDDSNDNSNNNNNDNGNE